MEGEGAIVLRRLDGATGTGCKSTALERPRRLKADPLFARKRPRGILTTTSQTIRASPAIEAASTGVIPGSTDLRHSARASW